MRNSAPTEVSSPQDSQVRLSRARKRRAGRLLQGSPGLLFTELPRRGLLGNYLLEKAKVYRSLHVGYDNDVVAAPRIGGNGGCAKGAGSALGRDRTEIRRSRVGARC